MNIFEIMPFQEFTYDSPFVMFNSAIFIRESYLVW